jgi:hypothetical protein
VVAGKAPEVVGKTWKKSWKAIQAKSLDISDTIKCIEVQHKIFSFLKVFVLFLTEEA